MDKQQATTFLNNLFVEVWTNLNESKVDNYYHKDVSLTMNNQKAGYEDIVNRLRYVKANFSKITCQIQNIIVDGDQISAYINQTYYKDNNTQPENCTFMAIYELKDNKVCKLTAITAPNFDYYTK